MWSVLEGHLIGVEFNYLGTLKQNVDTLRIPEAYHVYLRYQLKKWPGKV